MNEYTASNGVRVEASGSGLDISDPNFTEKKTYVITAYTQALREFFQHEKDEELGIWRSAAHPGWTAIRKHKVVYFHHEDHERGFHFVVGNDASLNAWSWDLAEVAREYLDAHPEPKPWEDAKLGEVWLLTINDVKSAFYPSKSLDRHFTPVAPNTGTTAIPFGWPEITAARRIWPEEQP